MEACFSNLSNFSKKYSFQFFTFSRYFLNNFLFLYVAVNNFYFMIVTYWGMTECDLCPTGTFQKNSQSHVCNECVPGYYQDREGQTDCIGCNLGTFSNETGNQFIRKKNFFKCLCFCFAEVWQNVLTVFWVMLKILWLLLLVMRVSNYFFSGII